MLFFSSLCSQIIAYTSFPLHLLMKDYWNRVWLSSARSMQFRFGLLWELFNTYSCQPVKLTWQPRSNIIPPVEHPQWKYPHNMVLFISLTWEYYHHGLVWACQPLCLCAHMRERERVNPHEGLNSLLHFIKYKVTPKLCSCKMSIV